MHETEETDRKQSYILTEGVKNAFRAYDIRGVYGEDLDEEVAERTGKAVGTMLGRGKTVGIARDVRLSSDSLHDALVAGLLSTGCSVVDFGKVPTPLLYFGTWYNKLDGGVMVTASHLPPEWNGFKISGKSGVLLSDGTGLEIVKEIFFRGEFNEHEGGGVVYKDVIEDYINYVATKTTTNTKFKIIFDFGNSVTSLVLPGIMKKLGHEAYGINEELDGTFPNRTSEPTEEALQNLKKKVLEEGADIGIGYDADGDRVAFVDEKGRISASGNITIPLLAKYFLRDNNGGKIVYDVTCSSSVGDYIRKLGGEPVIVRVGHSYCATEVMKQQALFGGQYSGHTAFPEVNCADDAIFGSLKILEVMSAYGKRMSELTEDIPTYFISKLEEIKCNDSVKFGIVGRIKKKAGSMPYKLIDIDGVLLANEDGQVLIRASNTSPVIRVNAEGKTEESRDFFQKLGKRLVKEENGVIREAVILAGGESNRMKQNTYDPVLLNTPKPLLEINGKPIISRKIEKLLEAGFKVSVVVSEKHKDLFEQKLGSYPITYAIQGLEKGTAAALYAAKDIIEDDLFLVQMADDLYEFDAEALRNFNTPTVFGFEVDDVSSYGLLVTDKEGRVTDIIEKQGKGRGMANTGMYIMHRGFFDIYGDIIIDKNSGERFLTHAVKLLQEKGVDFTAQKIDFWFGINTPKQLEQAGSLINSKEHGSDTEKIRYAYPDSKIKKAGINHLEKTLFLLYQLSPKNPNDGDVTLEKLGGIMKTISESDNHHLVVYEDGGEIAGTAMLVVQHNLTHGGRPYGHIENVVVDKNYRNKGIGKALINYLVEEARRRECYKVILNCFEDNVQFYSKCGLEKTGEVEMRMDLFKAPYIHFQNLDKDAISG